MIKSVFGANDTDQSVKLYKSIDQDMSVIRYIFFLFLLENIIL